MAHIFGHSHGQPFRIGHRVNAKIEGRRRCSVPPLTRERWRFTMPAKSSRTGRPPVPNEQRFWPKVNRCGPQLREGLGACWVWTSGTYIKSGYARFSRREGPYSSKSVLAHRFAFEMAYGPIPINFLVCHHCDNRLCVRPEHLFLGTQQDNMDDMLRKSRESHVGASRNPAQGMRQGLHKLTDDQVLIIRASTARTSTLAANFRVGVGAINRVRRRATWKHLA